MSILLIKDGEVYAPEHKGKKDILVINDKIVFIDQNILTSALNVIDKNIKILYLEESNPQESGFKKLLKLPILALKYRNFCFRLVIIFIIFYVNKGVFTRKI